MVKVIVHAIKIKLICVLNIMFLRQLHIFKNEDKFENIYKRNIIRVNNRTVSKKRRIGTWIKRGK